MMFSIMAHLLGYSSLNFAGFSQYVSILSAKSSTTLLALFA